MPSIEDILRTKTHKEQGVDFNRRVFYTLSDDKDLQAWRNTKAIAFLVNHLHEQGSLSDEAIEEMLLDLVT